MTHLGERLTAFVDGELDHEARERVLVHLTRCVECRSAVDAERQTKARLRALAGPDLPPGLGERLNAVATSPRPGRVLQRQVRGRRSPAPRSRRRRAAATSGAVVVGALSAAFLIGGGPAEGAPVTPNVDRYTVEHAVVSDEMVPLTDRSGPVVAVSFSVPTSP